MIYIPWGPPGAGKSYYATRWALDVMGRKGKRAKKVYSNYPIVQKTRKGYVSTYIWRPEYVYENIFNSVIIIDEAYRDYNSRNYRKFIDDIHVFFATNRHNGNDLILLTQNPARLDTVIREMTNLFLYIKPFRILLIERPIFFIVENFLTFEDFTHDRVYGKEFFFFRKKVAKSYDTHQFKRDGPEFIPEHWSIPEIDKGLSALQRLINQLRNIF